MNLSLLLTFAHTGACRMGGQRHKRRQSLAKVVDRHSYSLLQLVDFIGEHCVGFEVVHFLLAVSGGCIYRD